MRQRGSLTDEAVESWRAAPRTTPGGQSCYSPLANLTALTLKAVFRLALRQTEGLIASVVGLLGLELRVPDHSTLSRRATTLEVPRPPPRRDGKPLHLLVDSTGRIVAASLTAKEVDDGAEVGPLLDQVTGPVSSFTADGGYDQDRVYAGVSERHPEAAVIVPPRSTAVPSDTAATAPTQWDRHLGIIAKRGLSGAMAGRHGRHTWLERLRRSARCRRGTSPIGPAPFRPGRQQR